MFSPQLQISHKFQQILIFTKTRILSHIIAVSIPRPRCRHKIKNQKIAQLLHRCSQVHPFILLQNFYLIKGEESEMGGNSSAQKVTIDEKMQFLENRITKNCVYHFKQVVSFCSIPSCRKSPYLCEQCLHEKVHPHLEGIHDHNGFVKQLVTLIRLTKDRENKILQASTASTQDFSWVLKQEMKLLEQVESLEAEISQQFRIFKKKLEGNIDKNKKKADRTAKSQSETYYRFYSNPNILVNKLLSEKTDQFILDLKQKLNTGANSDKHIKISGEQEVAQLKIQIAVLKTSIRELLNVTNPNIFKKGNINPQIALSNPVVTLRKLIQIPGTPRQLFTIGEQVNVCTSREVHSIDSYTKQRNKLFGETLMEMAGLKSGSNQFIGIINPTCLLVYDGNSLEKVQLTSRVSTARILKGKKTIYGILGEDEGIINMVDLSQNKSAFHYRCGDKPLAHIEVCQKNRTIYAATRNGGLHLFRYQSRYDELDFEYVGQMGQHVYPAGQLQLMRIYNHELFLLGSNRNIVLFDLMLNTEVIRTQYLTKSPPFTYCGFATAENHEVMLTLNQYESQIYVWFIDRSKRTVRVEALEVAGKERAIVDMSCSSQGEVWVIKDGGSKIVNVLGLTMQ